MAISSALAAKRALYTALDAHFAADTVVRVWASGPPIDSPGYADIVVGRTEVSQEWGSLGASNPRRDEDITLTVTVRVFKDGRGIFDAEDQAWTYAEGIQTVLSADLTLSGTVLYCRPDRIEIEPESYDNGQLAVLTVTVLCRANNH